MTELMAFSATMDKQTRVVCKQIFKRSGAADDPDDTLTVYPDDADVELKASIERAMKETLYHNVRKLHIRLDPSLEAACSQFNPPGLNPDPRSAKDR